MMAPTPTKFSRGTIAAVCVAASIAVFGPARAAASPTPQPGLWFMNADGAQQRKISDQVENDGFFEWSPDGTRIAFSDYGDIFVTNQDGSEVLNLTETVGDGSAGHERQPTWSRDGSTIAFADAGDIWLIQATGTNRRNLTQTSTYESLPRWAPVGTHIAYLSSSDPWGPPTLVVADPTEPNQSVVVGSVVGTHPYSWSPDGESVVYATADGSIAIYDLMTRTSTVVVSGDLGSPAWSPDGASIAYAAPDGLYVVSATGGSPRRVSDQIDRWGRISWSPDSSKIAFASYAIHVVDLFSGEVKVLTHGNETDEDRSPAWSPDGSQIAFVGVIWCCEPTAADTYVGITLRKHLVVRGRLDVWAHECLPGRRINIQRRTPDGWRRVAVTYSDEDGTFRKRLDDRTGRYRTVATRKDLEIGGSTFTCLMGRSPTVRHQH